jgi:hypothetical protein
MHPPGASNPKKRLVRRTRTKAAPAANFDLAQADPNKLRVMAYFGKLVADGLAEWERLKNGTIRLRLSTGEIYLLEKETITRIT